MIDLSTFALVATVPVGNGATGVAFTPPPVRPVAIDVKPGSDPNSINPNSRGVIPVALLSDLAFDALEADAGTVGFGPAGAAPAHGGHPEDVDGDGLLDLTFHFLTQQAGIQAEDTQACLRGATFDGVAFEGCDSIRTRSR